MKQIEAKLTAGKKLSTADFKTLGYTLEDFLRYVKVPAKTRASFHAALLTNVRKSIA
jgi:hypothetical protein